MMIRTEKEKAECALGVTRTIINSEHKSNVYITTMQQVNTHNFTATTVSPTISSGGIHD